MNQTERFYKIDQMIHERSLVTFEDMKAKRIAAAIGTGLIALQWPLGALAFVALDGSAQVEQLAGEYFGIRIWAAPATLANYALLGWFVGLGRARTALMLYLTPVYAPVMAWALLGEVPRWYHAVGALLILPSIALATRSAPARPVAGPPLGR